MTAIPRHATPDGLDIDRRHEMCDLLDVATLAKQQVQGRVKVESEALGVVLGGLDEYLAQRKTGEFDVPASYASWDEGFEPLVFGHDAYSVKHGAVGSHEDGNHPPIHLCYESRPVRAAVRIVTGGGRYSASNITFHSAVPAAVVEGPEATVAVAPRFDNCAPDAPDPCFEYAREGTDVTGFHSVQTV